MTIRKQESISVRHVDLPELNETFADSLHTVVWDGQTLRVEFCVTRYPEVQQEESASASRYPVCRLVLTPSAAADLLNRLKQTTAAMAQRRDEPADSSPPLSS